MDNYSQELLKDHNNGVLFCAEYEILRGVSSYHMFKYAQDFLEDYWLFDGDETQSKYNFSHDNITGILCWAVAFEQIEILKEIPVFGKHGLHPGRFAFLIRVRYPWSPIGIALSPLAGLTSIYSCWSKRQKGPYLATDGKILAFFKNRTGYFPITNWICNLIVKRHGGWRTIFGIYHKNRHPILMNLDAFLMEENNVL